MLRVLSTEEQITRNQDFTIKKEKERRIESRREHRGRERPTNTGVTPKLHGFCFIPRHLQKGSECFLGTVFWVSFSTCQRHPQRARHALLPAREHRQTVNSGAVDPELANPASLSSHFHCQPIHNLSYVCSFLKTPYLIQIVDSLTLNSRPAVPQLMPKWTELT